MIALSLYILFNPLEFIPDSVDVTIMNEIEDASITSIHYLIKETDTMADLGLETCINPFEAETVRMPYRYMSRIVFGTDYGNNYRITNVTPGLSSDTLFVSRANKEFGGLFDVIMGSRPFYIVNATPMPITDIILIGEEFSGESIIGSNPMLSDETICLWLDADSISFTAVDIEGNHSDTIEVFSAKRDTVITISLEAFLLESDFPGNSVTVLNCINGEEIAEIEIYPIHEEPLYIDLRNSPLALWQSISVPCSDQIDYVVVIDCEGRTYSISTYEYSIEAFVADWWSLDFDFSFPDRRRR